mgnify:CR=1 FL=1
MSIYNSKTANALDLSDPLTKLQLEKDDLFDLFVEDESELKEGDYEGEILTMQRITGTRFYKAMIRIPTARCQEDPTRNPRFSSAQQKLLVYNHICAISESALGDQDSEGDTTISEEEDAVFCQKFVSMRVMVRFKQSPNQKGKTRFAKFRLPPITAQPSLKSGGCYNLDCPDTGLDGALSGIMSLFGGGGGFLWDTGNAGGPGGNPAHNTKLVKQKRTVKGKVIDWPIAWTVKPWTGTSYGDIAKCPYLSHKGLNYFADEKKGKQAPYLKPGEAPKPDLGPHKKNSTLLAREFMNLLASKLTFNITMTSNFRNAASNAGIMANTTFEHMTQGTGGLDQYQKSKATYINLYKKAKKEAQHIKFFYRRLKKCLQIKKPDTLLVAQLIFHPED